jgi:hypothetical protein
MKDYFNLADNTLLKKPAIKSFIDNKSFSVIDSRIALLKSHRVYNFLKNLYGEPNGYQEMDNRKIAAWEWIFKTDNGLIACYSYNNNWLIGYKGEVNKNLQQDAVKLFDIIAEKVFNKKIKKIRDKYEANFGILDNPFCFYQDIIFTLENSYFCLFRQSTPARKIGQAREKNHLLFLIFINYLILFEAFLNLVLFFFLKQDFRQDERLRLNIENEKIDIKLKMLDHYCFCFKNKPFVADDELYRAYMYLIGLRNSFIHAGIVDFRNIAWENKKVLVPAVSVDKSKYGIPTNPKNFDKKTIQNTKIIINSLIFRIINSMQDQYKYRFGLVYDWQTIQYKISQDNIYLTTIITKNNKFELYISDKEIEKELQKLDKFDTLLDKNNDNNKRNYEK